MKFTYSLCLLFLVFFASAQNNLTIDQKVYDVKPLVDGELSLYSEKTTGDHLYIMSYNNKHVLLERDNYRQQIESLLDRSLDIKNLSYRTRAFVIFTEKFNHRIDEKIDKLSLGLSVYGGVSNEFLFTNPNNEKYGIIGAELELYNRKMFRRHSLFFQFNQTINTSDYDFNLSQLTLNYRFRFIDTKYFYAAANVEFFSLNYVSFENSYYNQDEELVVEDQEATALDTPISFGASLNFNVSKVTTIFLSYNDFVALGVNDNGETPLDFSFGLRFAL
ncbi:hypothetical protein [Psychroflexus halocasei]|uniref:MetA-pathway of phenol degradation n=1 Tax=Psychroflexus halocasei TaxID=908615 RepID=A0A1H4D1Y9_9FLAO|nr:hypothetical protein [Psychroflexus halocasei]SEA66734.1 hypothetical protein SAMN05421540_10984 [Psychroflexus halocasei]